MPQAKKPASRTSRSSAAFDEPAALRRLSSSLDSAYEALSDLRKHTGRDVGQGARDLYKDLRTFVSSARRHTAKLAKALQRDFERAQKQVSGGSASNRSRRATAASPRKASSRPTKASSRSPTKASSRSPTQASSRSPTEASSRRAS